LGVVVEGGVPLVESGEGGGAEGVASVDYPSAKQTQKQPERATFLLLPVAVSGY